MYSKSLTYKYLSCKLSQVYCIRLTLSDTSESDLRNILLEWNSFENQSSFVALETLLLRQKNVLILYFTDHTIVVLEYI